MFNLFRNVSMNFYSPASSGGGASSIDYYLDKTWQELYDAVEAGKDVSVIAINSEDSLGFLISNHRFAAIYDVGSDYAESGTPVRYMVGVVNPNGYQSIFGCDSPDDYPIFISVDSGATPGTEL